MILKILTIVVLVVLRLFPRIEQCCFQKENFHFIWSLLSHNNKKNGGTVKGCNPNCVFHPPVFVHIFSKITGNLFKKKSIYCKKVFTLGWGGSAMGTDLAKKSCCMLITQASTEEMKYCCRHEICVAKQDCNNHWINTWNKHKCHHVFYIIFHPLRSTKVQWHPIGE